MVLRKKVLTAIIVALLILIGLLYVVARASVLSGFEAVEQEEIRDEMHRLTTTIERNRRELDEWTQDYAFWDAAFEYVQDPARHQDFLVANFAPDTAPPKFDLVVIVDQNGTPIFDRTFSSPTASAPTQEVDERVAVASDPDIVVRLAQLAGQLAGRSGILSVKGQLMLVAFQPIMDDAAVINSGGTLIESIFIDERFNQKISVETGISATISLTNKAINYTQPDLVLPADLAIPFPIEVYHESAEHSIVSVRLKTLDTNAILHLNISCPRHVYAQGLESLYWMLASAFLVGLASSMLGYIIFEQQVMQPITRLDDRVRSIADRGQAGDRVSLDDVGAFSPLGNNINAMLGAMEKAQRDVLASEARFRMMIESAPDPIVVIDADRQCSIEVNVKALQLFGHERRDDFLSNSIFDMALEVQPDGSLGAELFEQQCKVAQNKEHALFEVVMQRSDGQEIPCEVRLVRFPGEERSLLRASITDITERKQAEARAWQAQKLESLGLLAGGIAHDFNNILTGMLGQTSLALRKLPEDNPARTHVEKAITSAQRAAVLTRQLLAYAGRGAIQFEVISLNRLMEETSILLETSLPKHVRLQQELTTNLPLIEADLGQAQQVVMNLVLNAAEAIPTERAGIVHVSSGIQQIGQAHKHIFIGGQQAMPGRYVWLEVKDDGVGMDRSTIERIFDPFFTTKATGNGLGLSATLGIMRTHRGGVQVTSQPGRGTTFRIFFPAQPPRPERSDPLEKGTAEQKPLLNGSTKREFQLRPDANGVVLVIDDEAPVRETVSDILEASNLQVIAAAGGQEGVELYRTHGQHIKAVIVDMRMPTMDGVATFYALRQFDPKVKVILSSAYSETQSTQPIISQGWASFLPKPYESATLLARVQQLINPPPVSPTVSK